MSSPVSPTNFRRVDASPLVRVTARILTAPPTTGFAELGDAAPLPTVSPWMRVSQPPEWFLITSRRMRFASLVSAADSSCTHPSLLPSVIFAFAVVRAGVGARHLDAHVLRAVRRLPCTRCAARMAAAAAARRARSSEGSTQKRYCHSTPSMSGLPSNRASSRGRVSDETVTRGTIRRAAAWLP